MPPVPTCPRCGTHERVERESSSLGSFLCGRCWTLFDGNEDEWQTLRKLRETWEATYQRLRETNWKAELKPLRGSR